MSEKKNSDAQNVASSDVCRVGVRIPPFWPEKPAIWFAQIEGQFMISNITADATKFYYVISQLEPQYAAEVEDIVISPPSSNKYDKLKTELIKRLSASRERKVKQLLTHEELGDRTPSQFLRHLRHLAGPEVPDDFLRTIWMSRLPNTTQTIIVSQTTTSLETLAELADKIHDVVPPSPQVAAVAATDDRIVKLEGHIAELTRQMKALTNQLTEKRSRPRSRSRTRSSTRSHSNHRRYPTCWYHYKYGDRASKCVKPCDFSQAGNVSGNR